MWITEYYVFVIITYQLHSRNSFRIIFGILVAPTVEVGGESDPWTNASLKGNIDKLSGRAK